MREWRDLLPYCTNESGTGRGVADHVIDLLLPPRCVMCRALIDSRDGLCASCWKRLHLIGRPYCECLGIPFAFDPGGPMISLTALQKPPAYGRARAACLFGDVSRRLVYALKYGDRHEVVTLMARLMLRVGSDLLQDAGILIPVPLHQSRLWWRRFNQSALLAQLLARRSGRPMASDLLLRTRRTRPQVGLNPRQRARNLSGAFAISRKYPSGVVGKRVLLIDDVLTTGATADGCARVLLKAGAAGVDVLTFTNVADVIGIPS